MSTFPISRRHADSSPVLRSRTRRPLVEDLEGRRLLSGIVGNDIGMSVSAVMNQGAHIGTDVARRTPRVATRRATRRMPDRRASGDATGGSPTGLKATALVVTIRQKRQIPV
jgi:hypothetical protein